MPGGRVAAERGSFPARISLTALPLSFFQALWVAANLLLARILDVRFWLLRAVGGLYIGGLSSYLAKRSCLALLMTNSGSSSSADELSLSGSESLGSLPGEGGYKLSGATDNRLPGVRGPSSDVLVSRLSLISSPKLGLDSVVSWYISYLVISIFCSLTLQALVGIVVISVSSSGFSSSLLIRGPANSSGDTLDNFLCALSSKACCASVSLDGEQCPSGEQVDLTDFLVYPRGRLGLKPRHLH